MIVTKSDYDRWQSLYGEGSRTTSAEQDTNTQAAVDYKEGQELAAEATNEGVNDSAVAGGERPKTFLEEAFERVLLNRLGVDQGKMDELKEEIEKTEDAIEALSAKKPLSESQKKELIELQDKLETLKEALQELLRQANERANEEQALGPQSKERSAELYKSVSSFL